MTHLCSRRGLLLALAALVVPTVALAQDQDQDQLKLEFNGLYNAWFQNQQDFFLGNGEYNDRYAVQMFRLNTRLGYGDYIAAVVRFDAAQGWWGVDNDDYRDDFSNASSRWSNKDTNYAFHVDHAYLEFLFPDTPVKARVGRMFYGLGNKLILDSNFDGIQLDVPAGTGKFGLGWAKVSEGVDGLSDNDGTTADAEDADLFMATYDGKAGAFSYGLLGMYFVDRGDDDGTTFMPNGIDYFRSRFTPNISQLTVLGVTAGYAFPDLGLTLKGEFDWLTGKDDVANVNSGPNQLLDVNNGDLGGYNLYASATKTLSPKLDLGMVFGRGSGDDDLTGGKGNVNKLKTMGFFYITEVWEESIMPDEEGITPQGLGAPNTRAYRELENTTIIQGNLTFKPAASWRLHGAYSLIKATEPVEGWADADSDGAISPDEFTGVTSKDLGSEIDFLIGFKPYKSLDLVLRGGYMMVDDATGLLINGNTQFAENPWELKAMVTFTFSNRAQPAA